MTDLTGTLEGVGLPAVVRFLSGLHKSGCLRITHQDWNGEVFFLDGRVVSAGLGARHGLSALDALVQALPEGTFTFDSNVEPPTDGNIDLSQDELQAHLDDLVARTASGAPTLPSLDAIPQVAPLTDQSATEDNVPLDRHTLQTLLAVDGTRSVREIVAQRQSFEALWQLASLSELGLVRIAPASAAPTVTSAATPTAPPAGFAPTVVPIPAPQPATFAPVAPRPPSFESDRAGVDQPAAAHAATPNPGDTVDASVAAVHCPKLGFEDDPGSSFGRPTRLHRCFAAATPLPLSLDQQRELCLSEQFGTCPRLVNAGAVDTSTTPAPDARRPDLSPAAAPEGEPKRPDPRIVAFGGRNGGVQPGAPTVDRAAAASAGPARLRVPLVNPRDGGAVRPTPLRARMLRNPAQAVTRADDVTSPTPPIAAAAAKTSAPEDRSDTGGSSGVRRLLPAGVPVQVLAAIGLVVIVVALVALLLTPNLQSPLGEADIDSEALPNSSAVVAGTPISQIPLPRATAVAGQATEAGVGSQAQPKVEAQPTAAPAQPTAAPTAPSEAVATAAPPGSRLLLEESFSDNARGWPNDAQGVASVTGGTYRILPRQAGQFVAIGAPTPDVFGDTVVNATFRKLGGPAGGGYGVIVRDQGPGPRDGQNQLGRYYVLEVGDKGEIGIWRRDGDRWIDILPWERSDAVRPGNAVNELTVRAIGDRLSMSVNGAEVASVTDATLPAGGVGAFVGGDGNQVALEHFAIQAP